jgi:hypothetical protein
LFYLYQYVLQPYNFYLFSPFNLSLWIRSGYVLEILKNCFPHFKTYVFCFFSLKYKANFNGYATVLFYIKFSLHGATFSYTMVIIQALPLHSIIFHHIFFSFLFFFIAISVGILLFSPAILHSPFFPVESKFPRN